MKKVIIVVLVFFLSLTLTSCENPNYSSQITFNQPNSMGLLRYEDTIPYSVYGRFQPEGIYIKELLEYDDNDIEFHILHIFNENYGDTSRISSYGVSIISNKDLRVDVYSGYKVIFSFDFKPNGTFEYMQTIPNNLFVGVDEDSEISVEISPLGSNVMGDEFYSDTFTYIDNYDPTGSDLENYQAYQNLFYPINITIIIGSIFVMLYFISVIVYRMYYKKVINQLLEQENKTRFMLSPYLVAFGMLLFAVTAGIFTNELMKTRYHENHFSNIYVSATTTETWDLDWENITLSKLDVRVNDDEIASYMHVTDRIEITTYLDYSLIKQSVDNIIEYKKDEPVCWGEGHICTSIGFWSEIELYLTDGSNTFNFAIREYDEYTYYCAFSRASGSGLLYFTINVEDPYFQDVQHIHNMIEEAHSDYVSNSD